MWHVYVLPYRSFHFSSSYCFKSKQYEYRTSCIDTYMCIDLNTHAQNIYTYHDISCIFFPMHLYISRKQQVTKLGSGSLYRDLPLQPSVPCGRKGLALFLEMAGQEAAECWVLGHGMSWAREISTRCILHTKGIQCLRKNAAKTTKGWLQSSAK